MDQADLSLLLNKKTIFFDFDGVIKESVEVKADAFEKLFLPYGTHVATQVRVHHEANGGVSRYEKLPLYLKWAGIPSNDNMVGEFAAQFSDLAKQGVIDSPWVAGMPEYLINNTKQLIFFLITATPQQEMEEILDALNIRHCFRQVIGSPTNKTVAIAGIVQSYKINPEDAVMVGDSGSDYQAATENDIAFILRKTNLNLKLQKKLSCRMIKDFVYG